MCYHCLLKGSSIFFAIKEQFITETSFLKYSQGNKSLYLQNQNMFFWYA